MTNEQPADWYAEFDHKVHHRDNMRLEKIIQLTCTVGDQSETWTLGYREALRIVGDDSTSDFEGVLWEVAERFTPPAPVPTGEVAEKFWSNIFTMCEQWAEEMRPKNLDELLELMRADPNHPYLTGDPDCVNDEWADLPVFSDRPWVGDTEAIWSWDDNRCIVGTDRDNLEIEPREKWDFVPPKT